MSVVYPTNRLKKKTLICFSLLIKRRPPNFHDSHQWKTRASRVKEKHLSIFLLMSQPEVSQQRVRKSRNKSLHLQPAKELCRAYVASVSAGVRRESWDKMHELSGRGGVFSFPFPSVFFFNSFFYFILLLLFFCSRLSFLAT